MAKEHRPPNADRRTDGVTIGTIIGGIHNSIIAGRDVIVNTFTGSTEQQRAHRNRRAMLELVGNTWIKGVLEQSLHGAAMIELGLEERADAVERPWDMVLQTPDQPNRPLPHGTKIASVFDEMSGALLILGEPGSGKTTMLLELARDTIARAEEDLIQPIPVVFNLSSWAEKRQPIAEWLVDELNVKYNIPKKIARPWVENDDLLLLLDGLDEVKREHRDGCVEAINGFRQEHGMTLVTVCSRVADYEALATRLKLQGAVLLQPLTPEQVDQYLSGAGVELLVVRKTLQHDPTLQELAQTPLMLSIMTLAYQGMSVVDLGLLDTAEARRTHVFDAYVQRMFERRGVEQCYSPEQTVHWLSWLAQKMAQHGQSVFLIERIQPSWLELQDLPWLSDTTHKLLSVLAGALGGTLFGVLIARPGGNVPAGVGGGVAIAVLVGILVSAVLGFTGKLSPRGLIKPVEVIGLSWETLKGRLLYWLFNVLTIGVISLLSGGIRGALLLTPCFGILGLFVIILPVLFKALSVREIESRRVPNQGIRRSATNAAAFVLIGLMVGLTSGVAIGQVLELVRSVGVGLFAGFIGGSGLGLRFGGMAVIRHSFLRFILYQNGHIPWNYARFLDYATERIFLRKVGGSYVFIHRLLMDYLATPNKAAMAYLNRGVACYNSGDFRQAILEFTRAIELDPANAEAYHVRGIACQVSGDPELAIRDCTKAAELDPDNAEYLDSLCTFSSLSGHASGVIHACERAVKLNPDDGALRDSRGVVRTLTGDYDGAIKDFRFFVEWSEENNLYEWYAARRNAWIAELEAGRNPFDEATLEELLNETVEDLLDYFATPGQGQEDPLPSPQ